MRFNTGLSIKELGVFLNAIYECELNHRTNTFYALHKISNCSSYIPYILKIDETTLQEKLLDIELEMDISNSIIAQKIGLDKRTIGRIEKGHIYKAESYEKIKKHISSVQQ